MSDIIIELSEKDIHKRRYKPSLMDMNVVHPRKSKVFSSPKDYKRNPKHKGRDLYEWKM